MYVAVAEIHVGIDNLLTANSGGSVKRLRPLSRPISSKVWPFRRSLCVRLGKSVILAMLSFRVMDLLLTLTLYVEELRLRIFRMSQFEWALVLMVIFVLSTESVSLSILHLS